MPSVHTDLQPLFQTAQGLSVLQIIEEAFMNINKVTSAPTTMEPIPLASSASVSAPQKIDAAEKINGQLSESKRQAAIKKEEQASNFDVKEAKQLAEEMNEIMDDLQTSLGFSIREDLNHQVIFEISDRKTKELIKQIPSEEMLAIKEKMEEFSGLLFDQKV
jgi:flagellar protein FlaG